MKFRTLLENFDNHINKILDFLDLDWDENINNYRNTALNRKKIYTPSSSQVVQPLYKTSIAKWKNYEKYFSLLLYIFSRDKDLFIFFIPSTI